MKPQNYSTLKKKLVDQYANRKTNPITTIQDLIDKLDEIIPLAKKTADDLTGSADTIRAYSHMTIELLNIKKDLIDITNNSEENECDATEIDIY